MSAEKSCSLEQVLDEKQISVIVAQVAQVERGSCEVARGDYEVAGGEVRRACDGLPGYLGDHMKAALLLRRDHSLHTLHLFIKRIPLDNKPKADFIDKHNFYRREMLMYNLIDEMITEEEDHPWCVRAFLCTARLVVLPDVSVAGLRSHELCRPLDAAHAWLAARALARFHAAFADHHTAAARARPYYDFYRDHRHVLEETVFKDTPFVRTAAKLAADFLDAFSITYTNKIVPDLKLKLTVSFVDACSSFNPDDSTLNVLVHRDLWNNNMLFKYDEEGVPENVILIDFQCLRYGPPTFDLMSFLYMTTSREFRQEYETHISKYYLQVFFDAVQVKTRERLHVLYEEAQFARWCERSRMFGIMLAASICPLALMDPKAVEQHFTNPDTYNSLLDEDRSGLIIEYARNVSHYKQRLIEIFEEYVERYISGPL